MLLYAIRNLMKKIVIFLILTFITVLAKSQGLGLEDIIVEKYYVSDANDASATDGGPLPAGSFTYRIYVDMAPGWILQSVYASPNSAHDLRIETTTLFFNNEDRGTSTANAIGTNRLPDNTVMLDSWLSMGAASSTKIAVLKADDNDGAITNLDGFLQNNDSRAGIPINIKDGIVSGTVSATSTLGLDLAIGVLENSTIGSVFSITDGSWYNAPGVAGPAPENRILVAQLTTNGTLSFRLNLQLRRESDLKVEKYVHSNPIGNEILCEKCVSPGVPTGIKVPESMREYKVRVYPNPVNDFLNVDLGNFSSQNSYTLSVLSILGNPLIKIKDISATGGVIHDINVASLPSGIYILRISSDSGAPFPVIKFIRNHH